MKYFRIKGSTLIIKASCLKQAIIKLVDESDFTYKAHWYNRSNRKSWAEVETSYGYKCVVEEVEEPKQRWYGAVVAE